MEEEEEEEQSGTHQVGEKKRKEFAKTETQYCFLNHYHCTYGALGRRCCRSTAAASIYALLLSELQPVRLAVLLLLPPPPSLLLPLLRQLLLLLAAALLLPCNC